MTHSALNMDSIIEIPSDIISRINQDGTSVLMRMDNADVFYKIDGIASSVWSGIEDGKKLEEIVTEIQKSHQEISKETILTDVNKFLSDLVKFKLIDVC